MIIFLDTDILIDVALARHPWNVAAGDLLDILEKRPGRTYIAWHSIANFYYIVKPIKGSLVAKDFIRDLLRFAKIAPTNSKDVFYALRLPLHDFEDALQCAAAIASGADFIVSQNLKNYRNSSVPARSPEAVLKILSVK